MEPEAPPHRHRSRGVVRGDISIWIFDIETIFNATVMHGESKKKFQDIKEVIRSSKSKKDKQDNG
jgi:hypothetical protein